MTNFAKQDTDISQLLLGNNYSKKGVTILSGEVITTGMLLGVVTASQKLAQCKSGASDGSQIPKYVAVSDIDASAGDVVGEVGASGQFNLEKIVFDGSDTIETVVSDETFYNYLRGLGILVLPSKNYGSYDNA